MNCQEINSQLGALLDRELEPAQASMMRRHLGHCIECQGELERLRALKTALQSVESPAASARLDERVMEAFRLRHGRAGDAGKAYGWRAWIFNSFAIPKPALALIVALLVGTAALAYKAGEITGTRLQIITPPPPVYSRSARPPQTPESVRVRYIKTPGGCSRSNSLPSSMLARKGSTKSAGAQAAVPQFETQTYGSEAGIDYTTHAAIENLEPVKDASVRVIKGENR
ncbi:MAG TPA: zf-HC2 domain-containing protein [Blastocatellia bacterium]|jgi:anti-sigma factor RsiW|nr:zf-HC2 domain-containing protein [Blastocatellia bacterium]